MTIYIMEIIKIFSDTNDEERLYSTLLSEDEMRLYSEFQKEFNSKAQKALRKKIELLPGDRGSLTQQLKIGTDRAINVEKTAKRSGKDYTRLLDKAKEVSLPDAAAIHENRLGNRLFNVDKLAKKTSKPGMEDYLKDREKAANIIREKKAEKSAARLKASKESISRHAEKAKELKKIKNLKRGGMIAAGTIGTAGLAYGGKKLYDHYKNKE